MAKLPLTNSNEFALIDDVDLLWASRFQWRKDEDGHIVRDGMDQDGNFKEIYLCNEVISRRHGIPLHSFGPPKGVRRHRK